MGHDALVNIPDWRFAPQALATWASICADVAVPELVVEFGAWSSSSCWTTSEFRAAGHLQCDKEIKEPDKARRYEAQEDSQSSS